jgi:tetratricopeptide (TPR) repeat protein
MQLPFTTTNDSHWPVMLLNAVRIATYESEDSRTAIAQCLLGFDHFQQGAYAKAMTLFEHTLAQLDATQNLPLVEAIALGYMGQIYQLRSQHWYALACYEAALDACQSEGTPLAHYCQMKLYGWLTELCQRCGHEDVANDYCNKALRLRQQLNQTAPTPSQSTRSVWHWSPRGMFDQRLVWN